MNIDRFIDAHQLPAAFATTASDYYLPLAQWIERRLIERAQDGFVLGINGGQGTGKSTLTHFLCECFQSDYERSVVELSIDDIYLTRAERTLLGRTVHPLLATRGVPGTHDVQLGAAIIDGLRDLQPGEKLFVPRFDKSIDDRASQATWPTVTGPVDLIIFEGWCVGSSAQHDDALSKPVNALEAEEDADCTWRRYVNNRLATDYKALFKRLDALLFLETPSFDAVYRWRRQQEHQLRGAADATATGILSDKALTRFIQHYERITRANLDYLPTVADAVIRLGDDHQAKSIRIAQ